MTRKSLNAAKSESVPLPNDLLLPPDSIVDFPPVETRAQELPFEKLTWENFERLCYRLSAKDAVAEYWERYGRSGQAQAGIDIYVRRIDGQYNIWQCKRYSKKFESTHVKEAVNAFLVGKWKDKAKCLILAVTKDLNDTGIQDTIEEQASRLKKENITFFVYCNNKLSQEIKPYPDLVDDFFGRAWVEKFCGNEAVASLDKIGQKLDGKNYLELRRELFTFYKSFFTTLDRGLVSTTNLHSGINNVPELLDRFIVPDVINKESYTTYDSTEQFDSSYTEINGYYQSQNTYQQEPTEKQSNTKKSDKVVEQIQRRSVQNWLIDGNQVIILGDAGSGKSTLLRCLALDLLSNQSVFSELSKVWGDFIPIIVPFARWTKAISENHDGVSLEEMICKWLKNFSISETLISLIKVALQDRRLLLLVDGLDEWNNETAARTALDQLETVVKTNNVAAILTGRPSGVSKLGGLGHPWRSTELAQLSKKQQRQLAEIWFGNSLKQSQNNNTRQALINWQIDNFFKDLQDSDQLQDISSTPLLLTGLISLRVRQLNLPRNRFQIYEELTKLLLEFHPQTRSSASSETQQRFKILDDVDIRRRVLGKLAFEIRTKGADNGFSKSAALNILIDFLKDGDVIGLSTERARKGAQEILAINAETSGILIEKSSNEIGFVHAVFEEYLTAAHISSFEFKDQHRLVLQKCNDPRWRNVILSLFHQLTRPNEVDKLIEVIEEADVDIVGDIYRRQLLAEAVFGNNRCTPRTSRRIAQEIINKINFGYWMPERRSLLKYALMDGVSGNLTELQHEKLKCWYPETQRSRAQLFDALSLWSKDPTLQDVLMRGVFDSDISTRRSAAKALAKVYKGDGEVKQRLLIAIKEPYNYEITATLLFTLTKGWPEYEGLKKLIDLAKASENYDMQLEGVLAAIDLRIHTEQDRDLLLHLSHRSNINYSFKNELIDAFLKEWCNDPVIFEACWKAWLNDDFREDAIDNEIAQKILLLGYASDNRVVEHLYSLLTSDSEYFGKPGSYEPWDEIAKSFTKHPYISEAVDKYIEHLEKYSFRNWKIALLAKISQSAHAKGALLNQLKNKSNPVPHWPVWGLLNVWGMEDSEVREGLLNTINTSDLKYLEKIAHLLPDIIKDKIICKQKLLEIAQLKDIRRPDLLVEGFARIGINHTDYEIVNLLLLLAQNHISFASPIIGIIRNFSLDKRVRKFAFDLIDGHKAPLATIAEIYSNDNEIRAAILNQSAPLPSFLRKDIVLLAERRCDESTEFNQVLLQYKNEYDVSVRIIAESAYYSALKRRGDLSESVDVILTEELLSIGHDFEAKRQSAFAGIISSGRLSLFKNLTEQGSGKPLTISVLDDLYQANTALIKMTAAHWGEISSEMIDPTSRLISWNYNNKWHVLAPFLNESDILKQEFLKYCRETEDCLTSNSLQALAKLKIDQFLLKAHCERIINNKEHKQLGFSFEKALTDQIAGKILGTLFAEDIKLEDFLSASLTQQSDGAIIALALAFPTNPELKSIYKCLLDSKPLNISWVTALYLVSACGDDSFFEKVVCKRLSLPNLGSRGFHSECIYPIVRHLSKDKESYNKFFIRLKSTPSNNELASLSRLLALSSSGNEELYDWFKEEVIRQTNKKELPDSGYDLVAGRVRPILQSLFDILLAY